MNTSHSKLNLLENESLISNSLIDLMLKLMDYNLSNLMHIYINRYTTYFKISKSTSLVCKYEM